MTNVKGGEIPDWGSYGVLQIVSTNSTALLHPTPMTTPRKRTHPKGEQSRIAEGAVAASELKQEFPPIALPIRPPYPPMEAKLVDEIPRGENWQYEPKWDGFRCVAFRKGEQGVVAVEGGAAARPIFSGDRRSPAEAEANAIRARWRDRDSAATGICRSTIC